MNSLLTPVAAVPGLKRQPRRRYREVCDEFLASGEPQVRLDWQAFAPGRSLMSVTNSWRTFFSDPARDSPEGVRVVKRGEELFLVRTEAER